MIISASRRTDIPAFYSKWFMNRIREGYVLTQNPFNTNQVKKIILTPYHIDAIIFWTRNPKSLIPYLDELHQEAQEIGAINCITNKNGKTKGFNTDAFENKKTLTYPGECLIKIFLFCCL